MSEKTNKDGIKWAENKRKSSEIYGEKKREVAEGEKKLNLNETMRRSEGEIKTGIRVYRSMEQ